MALLAAAGCSNGSSDTDVADRTTTTTTSSTTTSTTVDPAMAAAASAIDGYKAAEAAAIEAGKIPDPNLPALAATHIDPMLQQRRLVFAAMKRDGRVWRYPANTKTRDIVEIEDVEIDGVVARFEACAVDDGEEVEVATNRVIDGGVVTIRSLIAMELTDGVWKLAERKKLESWNGVAGCAL